MIVLVGASASGKTELSKILYQKFGYQKCVTSTTREPRIGEIDGVDYHFLSLFEFHRLISEDQFIEVTPYHNHLYGIQKKDIKINGVVIVEPNGANTLIEKIGFDAFIIYVHASKDLRSMRMEKRKDTAINIQNRLAYDDDVFQESKFKRIDLLLENENHDLIELAKNIHETYQTKMKNKENSNDH